VTRTDERTRYRYYTVDVFTAERFGGNPLAVFPRRRRHSGKSPYRRSHAS
jgi:predicted PhzF superfamily epimerase YddE/YHI9